MYGNYFLPSTDLCRYVTTNRGRKFGVQGSTNRYHRGYCRGGGGGHFCHCGCDCCGAWLGAGDMVCEDKDWQTTVGQANVSRAGEDSYE